MTFNGIFSIVEETIPSQPAGQLLDFVPATSPHQSIAKAYDKAAKQYDDYISGDSPALKLLKRIALGLDKEAEAVYLDLTRKMLSQLKGGLVLDVPAGTGLYTFDEYVKHPEVQFVCVEYSQGMLEQARQRREALKAKNLHLVRADVARLPFKNNTFDAAICLNGIHSFPEKDLAIGELARVLKPEKKLYGSMILKGERKLTDFVLKTAYFRLGWFTRPALSRDDLAYFFSKHHFAVAEQQFLKAATTFALVKQ